ncbi:MAG: SH3 domain-containing protein [Bdellovibrionales bacterium]|nr:SH3 domain-containing protein [Bdellovibrionales bacterium]
MKLKSIGLILLVWSATAQAVIKGVVSKGDVPVWPAPSTRVRPLGILKQGTVVEVVSRTANANYVKIKTVKASGGTAIGYVRTGDLEFLEDDLPANRERLTRDDDDVLNRWSFGAGLSGYSSGGVSSYTVSADLRYLWSRWTESILGLDLSFADSQTLFGGRVAQRLYAPLGRYRPYLHGGYRLANFKDLNASAIETGAGLQVVYGNGSSYFEVGVTYLIRKPFQDNVDNAFILSGSSGLRF